MTWSSKRAVTSRFIVAAQLAVSIQPLIPVRSATAQEHERPLQTAPVRSLLGPGSASRFPVGSPEWIRAVAVDASEQRDARESALAPSSGKARERAASDMGSIRGKRAAPWMWLGSAALVALFVARASQDLSREEPALVPLPGFPRTP